MTEVKIAKLSPKVRAQRLEKKLAQRAKLEAELAALEKQEEEYQAEQMVKAWETLTTKLEKELKIDDVEQIELLTEVLTAEEMIEAMKSSIEDVAADDAEEDTVEVVGAPADDTPTDVPSPARHSVSVQAGDTLDEEEDNSEEVSSGFENSFKRESASSSWRDRYMG